MLAETVYFAWVIGFLKPERRLLGRSRLTKACDPCAHFRPPGRSIRDAFDAPQIKRGRRLMSTFKYVLKRLAFAVLTFFIIISACFLLVRMLPN